MDDLAFDAHAITAWFVPSQELPFVLVHIRPELTATWAEVLVPVLRRCYVLDSFVEAQAVKHKVAKSAIVASRLPDPGAIMSGDFGEILTYLYHVAVTDPSHTVGVKKWRLKQDRRKPAPHSDVLHFILPAWPIATSNDAILCSEVKAKATDGTSKPITEALEDSRKDSISRLAITLTWLRERALNEDLGDITLAHLNRFIDVSDHPAATKIFRGVAVVCESLLTSELATVPDPLPPHSALVIIAVPALKDTYGSLFSEAVSSLA